VETFNLQLVKFDKETAYEVLKDIAAVINQLCSLFICQDLLNVLFWFFKIRKQKYENFCFVARYLYQINLTINLMEVTVLDPSLWFNTVEAETNIHRRRSLFAYYIKTRLRNFLFRFLFALAININF